MPLPLLLEGDSDRDLAVLVSSQSFVAKGGKRAGGAVEVAPAPASGMVKAMSSTGSVGSASSNKAGVIKAMGSTGSVGSASSHKAGVIKAMGSTGSVGSASSRAK